MISFRQTGEVFSDIYAARDGILRIARGVSSDERIKIDVILEPDEYFLHTPLVFSVKEEESLKNVELSFSCDHGDAVFTSERVLNCEMFVKNGDYYTYQFEKDAFGNYPLFHDFYVDGHRLPICRSQTFVHAFTFSAENNLINDENLEGIYIPKEAADLLPDGDLSSMEFTIYVEWECFVMHALSLDRTRTKTDEEGNLHYLLKIAPSELYGYVTGMTKCLKPKGREFFLGNHPCVLSEDTWCYDHKKGILYYAPKDGILGECTVPMLTNLFCFEGMDGVHLENLLFTGVTDRYTCQNGYLSHQANVEKQIRAKVEDSAILARDVSRFTIEKCRFYELGSNAILMLGNHSRVYIRNSFFEYVAMCAISIGDPVIPSRTNRFGSYDVRIENNFMRHIAFDFPTAPAIDVFRVDGLSICYNTIEECAYTGISVGWGWGLLDCALGEIINIRDAEIAYNRIVNFMQSLRDGGAIYAVGANCTKEYTRYFNFMHDNYAYRDSEKTATVRGFYLDGSSTNWHVYDNVGCGMQRPAFAQFHVPTEFTWNVRLDNTYTTDHVDSGNHAPERNSLLGDVYGAETLTELFEKYPKAKDIFKKSGCQR